MVFDSRISHRLCYNQKILNNKNFMKQISIYTTPTCMYCKASKDFFKENNIQYQEYNVATDLEKRKEMIEKSGQMGVPVVFIDNEMVVGFDRAKLTELLGL